MRVLTIVGTRPQLIKAAALQPTLRAQHDEWFVDTGQHWDDALAGSFFHELGLAVPDASLALGGGSHADQTARMLGALGPIIQQYAPDAVLVYGDTNSTLAGALAAAKLGVPVAHVEAGLRSFDRRMPEEVNRIVADHLATWLFAPTSTAVENLAREGIRKGVTLVGDLMQDLARQVLPSIREPSILREAEAAIGLTAGVLSQGEYLFATIHRQENRDPAAITQWLAMMADAAHDRVLILALHPGTRVAIENAGAALPRSIIATGPLPYRMALALQLHAAAVITDSGGIQREASWLGVPCIVLRGSTEWIDLVADSGGRTVLVGLDLERFRSAVAAIGPRLVSAQEARRRANQVQITGDAVARTIAEELTKR